ncbi:MULTISPECIES: hypothetical protein [unclassified Mycobacterium]|uniref:hypothetical protein n=1 Tax=unclassified Mycobacterium TaxID=2642494 RepID=UPI0007FFB2F3|nr:MULTISPECIES: hypothetical protein [unclassified Mycobacterium]OBG75399.1 hypothetical protein A5700_01745 [Mycobacterium sp. E1214]OBH30485.1 hypothetical protein A5693_17800 [Mycobacterium sp. E1319]
MTVEDHAVPDGDDPVDDGESARASRPTAIGRGIHRYAARWRSILATSLVVAAVGVAAGLYVGLYRPDQRIGDAAARRAIQAASDGTVAVLSYSYDHLDSDFAAAKSRLTGDFLNYYGKFTADVVGPTAREGQLTVTANAIRAAVADLHPDRAAVLVFVDQTTASMQKKDPVKTQSSVLVTLTKTNGTWLIAKFDPSG